MQSKVDILDGRKCWFTLEVAMPPRVFAIHANKERVPSYYIWTSVTRDRQVVSQAVSWNKQPVLLIKL